MRLGTALAVALALAGCSADYVEDSEATVLLVVASINDGKTIASDVRGDGGTITNCSVQVKLAAPLKNPKNPGSVTENILLQRYDVSFSRADGRGIEGVDVPYRFSAAMAAYVARGAETAITVDIVRQQAKLEPPLSNITGKEIVEMIAHVTVYGQTVSRDSVSASGAVQIRFADYGTGTATCEAGGSGS